MDWDFIKRIPRKPIPKIHFVLSIYLKNIHIIPADHFRKDHTSHEIGFAVEKNPCNLLHGWKSWRILHSASTLYPLTFWCLGDIMHGFKVPNARAQNSSSNGSAFLKILMVLFIQFLLFYSGRINGHRLEQLSNVADNRSLSRGESN